MLSAIIPAVLSYPAMDRAVQLAHQGYVLPNPLVLRKSPLNIPTPTADRDRPGSRRSEPSSRSALMAEQPNPWRPLLFQDAKSRHRGAKPSNRYELSNLISLLSLAYLLSVERYLSHTKISDHYGRLKYKSLFDMSV